jgi:hypothetical protein
MFLTSESEIEGTLKFREIKRALFGITTKEGGLDIEGK